MTWNSEVWKFYVYKGIERINTSKMNFLHCTPEDNKRTHQIKHTIYKNLKANLIICVLLKNPVWKILDSWIWWELPSNFPRPCQVLCAFVFRNPTLRQIIIFFPFPKILKMYTEIHHLCHRGKFWTTVQGKL